MAADTSHDGRQQRHQVQRKLRLRDAAPTVGRSGGLLRGRVGRSLRIHLVRRWMGLGLQSLRRKRSAQDPTAATNQRRGQHTEHGAR